MKKKHWIILACAVVVVAAAVWGVFALRRSNNKVYVQPVEYLNCSWVLSGETGTGTIAEAAQQQIYAEGAVAEVYVPAGTAVKPGDALLRYDDSGRRLDVQQRQLNVDTYTASLSLARQKLDAYRAIEPVSEPEEDPSPLTPAQQLGEPVGGDGSADDPLVYLCTADTVITGSQINTWIAGGLVALLQITDESGAATDEWRIDGAAQLTPVDEWGYWHAATRLPWEPPAPEVEPGRSYTAVQKAKLVADQELAVRKLENALALAENALAQAKRALDGATVRATLSGTVTVMGDPNAPPQDGSAFCVVTGDEGVTLTGYVSELARDHTRVGDRMSVSSWMSGAVTDAHIIEISDYPVDEGVYYGYGVGNPNASYYRYTAYMDNADGFSAGEEVSIQPYVEDLENMIVLPKVYVRSDGDGAYVMVDEGGLLARRGVTVRAAPDTEYVQVLTGLGVQDLLAFPYGRSVYPGALTTTEDQPSLF